MATFYQYLVAFILSFLELLFIAFKGYFLSIEFTLYPYLIKNNFLPYKNIIDQHFPSLFFGTFSLPQLSSTSPLPLTILFATILVSTNLLLFRYLLVKKVSNPVLWLSSYIVLISYFSANILWVESFINLLLVVVLNLSIKKNKTFGFIVGLLFSQIILMRPTILPALFLLFLYLEIALIPSILGAIFGFILSFAYLVKNNILNEFFELTINFNSEVYANSSKLLPSLRQLGSILIIATTLLLNTFITKKWLNFYIASLCLLLVFPRFGLEHLQPFILLTILFLSLNFGLPRKYLVAILILFLSQIALGLTANRYGNYFYQPRVISVADKVKDLPNPEIYLFGASDLIYPLSGKLPAGSFYVPSLPWYLNYSSISSKLLQTLQESNSPILVDTSFTVDGVLLTESASQIYEYIKINYNLIDRSDSYELYFKKL